MTDNATLQMLEARDLSVGWLKEQIKTVLKVDAEPFFFIGRETLMKATVPGSPVAKIADLIAMQDFQSMITGIFGRNASVRRNPVNGDLRIEVRDQPANVAQTIRNCRATPVPGGD